MKRSLGYIFNRAFSSFFDIYYYLNKKHPLDCICFPLPFKMNCVGCFGCASNQRPFLSERKYFGKYKVVTTETFNESYAELFGKGALVELLYKLEKSNEEVDLELATENLKREL